MQESLKLIQIPKVDTSRLSRVGEFRRIVERIERKHNLNLEFNNNARWRPGSYERLKEQVTHSLFPHWSKPKGANTIRRLTKHHSYQCTQLASDLIMIDDELKGFRNAKQSLDSEKATLEGQMLLTEYMNEVTRPIPNTSVEITSLPYFAKKRRSNECHHVDGGLFEYTWDNPLHPEYDRVGELVKYNISRSKLEELYKVYNLNTNPQRWYINIIIPLEDVDIDYYIKTEDSGIVCTNPYGGLVVCFTIPLYDAILGYRQIKMSNPKIENQHTVYRRLNLKYLCNHTFKFPYMSSIKHPFIQSGGRYSYDLGNTCFGDFKEDIVMALFCGMIGPLKAILTKWASTYYLGNTSPLNQTEYHHIGMPKEWKGTAIPDYMGTNISICRDTVRNGVSQEQMLARFCSKCALSEKNDTRDVCEYYLRLSKEPIAVPPQYLAALDAVIEQQGLPGLAYVSKTQQFKAIIQTKAIAMWNIVTSGIDSSTRDFTSLWKTPDMGAGNCDWAIFEDTCTNFSRNVLEYTDHHNSEGLARDAYLIYRYCERIYWLDSLGSYDGEMRDNIEDEYYDTINKAEELRPVLDYRSMVNTHRLSTNQTLYPEYLDILLTNSQDVELDDTLNAWLHANDEEAERGPTNERNPF